MDIRETLKSLGYEVPLTVDKGGAEALKGILDVKPDLILLDITLKGKMNGIELANGIREKMDIPIIYITAHSKKTFKKRTEKTEPHGYLTKPFDDEKLRLTIQKALYKH